MKETKSEVLCLDCYCQQIIPSDCYFNTNYVSTTIKTQKEMLKELVDSGWVVNTNKISIIDTLDLYDALIANRSMSRFEENVKMVRFPLYEPNQLDNVIDGVQEINLFHGGIFIGDNAITIDMVIDIVKMLSSYVIFDGRKYVNFQDTMFMAIPAIIVDLAYY